MLILKVHYFLWFGSLSGVLPYTAVFGKYYSSASATEVGFLYTILPFVAMLVKPIGCACADRFAAHKLVLVTSLILTLLGYGSLILVPWFTSGSGWVWWFFCSAVLIANSAMGLVTTMTDSLAMREASNGRSSFGAVRVFGTLGYGILGLAAGGVNDNLFTGLPYLLPGLIMFVVVICIDILAIVLFLREAGVGTTTTTRSTTPGLSPSLEAPFAQKVNNKETADVQPEGGWDDAKQQQQVWRIVMKSFINFPSLVYYCLCVFMCGLLTAFHWSFFFWYLENIQPKDTLLMGLCLVVQSFLGEVPFFLCSEWIVQKIGFDYSLAVTFASIAIRYLSYGYFIRAGSAYYVLIVELTQGPSFGLFYVVMTSIAQSYSLKTAAMMQASEGRHESLVRDDTEAKGSKVVACSSQVQPDIPDLVLNKQSIDEQEDPCEKTHATMQGIMSGVYEGAGLGIGALIAGLCIDRLGSESTWKLAGFLSLAVCISNLQLGLNLDKCTRRRRG